MPTKNKSKTYQKRHNGFTMIEVATLLGLQRSHFLYLIEIGRVPRPTRGLAARKYYNQTDVDRIRLLLKGDE